MFIKFISTLPELNACIPLFVVKFAFTKLIGTISPQKVEYKQLDFKRSVVAY